MTKLTRSITWLRRKLKYMILKLKLAINLKRIMGWSFSSSILMFLKSVKGSAFLKLWGKKNLRLLRMPLDSILQKVRERSLGNSVSNGSKKLESKLKEKDMYRLILLFLITVRVLQKLSRKSLEENSNFLLWSDEIKMYCLWIKFL